MDHTNITSTKETTPFHIFKDMVARQSGLTVSELDTERLSISYDMGESVWSVSETQKLFAHSRKAKPFSFSSNMKACVRRVSVGP